MNAVITQEELKELLDYNSETGVFVWKERKPEMFLSGKQLAEHPCMARNAKYAAYCKAATKYYGEFARIQ